MILSNMATEIITVRPPHVGIGYHPHYVLSKYKSDNVSKYSPNGSCELENNGVWSS